VYRSLDELTYPFHDQTIMVTGCGPICFRGRKVNLSHVFAGQSVGLTQVGEHIWLVTFMHYDLGYFDDETCRLEPIENLFGPKLLPVFNPSARNKLPPIRPEWTLKVWLAALDFRNWFQLGVQPAKGNENPGLDRMRLGAARSRLAMEQSKPSNCLVRSVRD
jgi:hypothetical protein